MVVGRRTTFWIASVTIALSIVYFVQAVQHGRIFSDMGLSSPSRISIFVTIASAGTIVGSFLFSRLRLSVSRLLALGLFAYGVAYVGVFLAPNLWIGLPVDALGQIGGGLILPTLIAWSLSKYDFEHRGRGMGIWGGCFFLGQFLSPPLMTLIGRTQSSFLASVAVMGGCCLVVALVVLLLSRRNVAVGVPGVRI
jgi:Major Facilitator Superfamily